MLDLNYNYYKFAEVKNVTGFFKELGHNHMMKVKAMHDNIKLLFNLNKLMLYIAEGAEIYQFIIPSQDFRNLEVGRAIYQPVDKRLDLWMAGDRVPLIQFKGKKVVHKNYSPFLDMAGLDKLFGKLTNSL